MVAVVDGLFDVALGTSEDLSVVPFEAALTLGIQVGTDAEMSPRLPVTFSPGSMHAVATQPDPFLSCRSCEPFF